MASLLTDNNTNNILNTVQEYRLLLVGKTGAGKSATGNSILGNAVFPTSIGLKSKTAQTQCSEAHVRGHKVVVVDTPGFFDTEKGNDFVMQELIKIYGYLTPGFHALIYVVSPDRFTKECIKTKNLFIRAFGERATQYTIILVTGLDRIELEGSTFRRFLAQGNSEFTKFRQQCKNRILPFNNKADEEVMLQQVDGLLDLINTIQASNGNTCFTNLQFQTMKMYKRLGNIHGKTKLKQARKSLRKKIAERYGVEQKYAWGPESRNSSQESMYKALPTSVVHDKKDPADISDDPLMFYSIESSSESDENDDTEGEINLSDDDLADDNSSWHRESLRSNPSYLERLITFFSRLFRPLIEKFLRSDE